MNENRLPLYIKIASDLKFKINSGEWGIEEQLPTEENLCDIYDVSRITIRRAFDELVKEGYIYKKRAVGTFVKDRKQFKTKEIRSFSKEMESLGRKVKTLDANIEIKPASLKLANFLNVSVGEEVLNLQRIFGSKDNPFVYFDTYVTYVKGFSLDSGDYLGSFYDYLKAFDIEMNLSQEYLEAVYPSQEIIEKLPISETSPMLKRVRLAQDLNKEFYEYSECFYIGSEYRYYVN